MVLTTVMICNTVSIQKMIRENVFLIENATERYIHFKKLYPEISKRVPQRHIATYLGITPESLSRIRSAMKDE